MIIVLIGPICQIIIYNIILSITEFSKTNKINNKNVRMIIKVIIFFFSKI